LQSYNFILKVQRKQEKSFGKNVVDVHELTYQHDTKKAEKAPEA